ncbi:MAG: bifunctional nicotinamidase/pyrazinamidase [Bryobacterales bacterium]|nr:bifunctional nicotinamidase/pyrazinamidase [Acidobacteriota bacterium]MCB9384384.1 bifunctional nicotinamidase/pyrazinamidase [Bryobacterales bacterium]
MNALLLIDLQYDFMPGGALAVEHGDEVVSVANALMPRFGLVAASQDWHPADHGSFASQHAGKQPLDVIELDGLEQTLWPDHCVQGTHGAELAAGLDQERIARVIHKGTDKRVDSYSAFFDNAHRRATGLEAYLRGKGVEAVYLMGLATDYCVQFSALDAAKLGFRTFVYRQGCRGIGVNDGGVDRAWDAMRQAGVTLLDDLDTP